MAWRAIQDSVATSESLSACSDFAERVFWRLLAKTDAWGRLPSSPRKLRALCLPLVPRASENRIEKAVEELEAAGRLISYEADGYGVLEVVDFEHNQPGDVLGRSGNRYASKFPDPPRGGTPRRSAPTRAAPAESESETDKKSATHSPQQVPEDVQIVYDHWREVCGKTDSRYERLSPGRKQKINARLREYTVDQLCRAIDGVALDDWPDRQRYNDLTIIFANRERVDRFLGFADSPPQPRPNGRRPDLDLKRIAAEVFSDAG